MDDSLFEAYRNTSFFADTPSGRLRIRVGQTSRDLDLLLGTHGARTWTYVTAFNPGSVMLSAEENWQRQVHLEAEVTRSGFVSFLGEGVGDDERWPPEPSLLILGIDEIHAIDLGRRFGQRAVVYGEAGAPAVLLRCL